MDVQRKRANVAHENRPLDHDSNRSIRRRLVCGRYQHALAADVHRSARTLYLLSPMDGVTGTKLDGEANSAATFRSIEGHQALHR
jgi:hypothetical protein